MRFGNHLHDLRQDGLPSNSLSHHDKAAGIIERAADHFVTWTFLNRQGFARKHRLIDCCPAFDNAPIHRDLFAGPHAEMIAAFHIAQRNVSFLVIQYEPGCRGRKI